VGLLLQGSALEIARVAIPAAVGIAALACGVQGWMFRRTTRLERLALIAAGLLLLYPASGLDLVGGGLVAAVMALQRWRRIPASAA
jgi:TRAP-type uncharacterized transport system fused permease subunit